MEDPLQPRNRRERKRFNYFRAATTGKVTWNARGIEECIRYLNKTFNELSLEERADWNPYIESLYFIKNKYGETKGTLYCARMGQVINFIIQYRKRMRKDKLVSVDANGTEWWEENLTQAFAKLPYTFKSFRYQDVKAYVERCNRPS
jgi:hypothetical protein